MRSVGQIADTLTSLLPGLSRTSGIVDDAVRLRQFPHADFVDNVVEQARVLGDAAVDLAAHPGYEGIARRLNGDAISVARKAGVMHAMNEHRKVFEWGWQGQFHNVVRDVTDAVQQLT